MSRSVVRRGSKFLNLIALLVYMAACSDSSPQSRNFFMGFSPWPYDATIEAVDWTYATLAAKGDIISHHMEEGVPWPEALTNGPLSLSFSNEIRGRLDRKIAGQKVLLQISPLNTLRDGLALYRGTNQTMALPFPWNGYAFDDADVETAFLNYAKRMVQAFTPDYLLIGVEVNLLIRNTPSVWSNYINLHRYVYTQLKVQYPDLPIGVSVFCVPFFPEWSSEDDLAAQTSGLADIEPYTDYLAFSVHPFMSALLADSFPDDYFDRLFAFASKPVAVSESSYPAQVWQTTTNTILTFNGSEEKQRAFTSAMLTAARQHGSEYVIWFSVRDFDALWSGVMKEDPVALIWRDTGLYDADGTPRLALQIWEEWLGR